jgi:4-hydroxy-4-methyl-2-oxoglutarate aldolase
MGFYRSDSAAAPPPSVSTPHPLAVEVLDAIRQFDTCTIANAIEKFKVRLRNEGFTRPGLRCVTGGFPRLLGYAATCTVRAADPPMAGDSYADRTDWWAEIGNLPVPRIAVIQDLDAAALGAATVGEVHAAILKAFHCEGLITNGAVRDLPAVSRMQFPMFASSVAVSHAYTHMVEYGKPVEIFGLTIQTGDLLYADCHGVVSIPLDIAPQIPDVAAAIRAQERQIVDLCQSPEFSIEKLLKAVQNEK